MNYKHGRNIKKFNQLADKKIGLKEGKEWCDKCDGLGYITYDDGDFRDMCFKCQGYGQVDWVDKLIPGRIWNG